MSRQRREQHDATLSFLDIICCGFGAIVLLLVIVRPSQPIVLETPEIVKKGQLRKLQERLFSLRGEITYLETRLNAKQEQLGKTTDNVAILQAKYNILIRQQKALVDSSAQQEEALQLQVVLQSLTQEMRRLLKNHKKQSDYIGGIPIDSEYLVFIIDTSGSMFAGAWPRVISEMGNILDLYPKVKGIQVMNDQGQYMFTTYRGKWIPDTQARRKAIVQKLRNWNPFSNSSPEKGIITAIREFYDAKKKVSLYIFGDDFSKGSVKRVVDIVNRYNKKDTQGQSLVRIHAVGFPVLFAQNTGPNSSVVRFANLMREITRQNSGSFIGLNSLR